MGVAAVDIESKSLGQYPLSNARGCYAITVDLKGTCPLVYRAIEALRDVVTTSNNTIESLFFGVTNTIVPCLSLDQITPVHSL